MNDVNVNALLVRAIKTFLQGFIAAWAVTGQQLSKSALIGAVAAGVSAVMNLFLQPQEAK